MTLARPGPSGADATRQQPDATTPDGGPPTSPAANAAVSWSVPIAHPAGVHDAARAPRFEGAVINATTARRLLANDDAMLYDNPQALLLCHYKREQALCHRTGMRETPRLDHCVPRCGNIEVAPS